MRVELALFDGDTLLGRSEILVTSESGCDYFQLFHAAHRLEGSTAQIVLFNFDPSLNLKTVNLDMPIHVSDDWESIDLAGYTLGFRCSLDA
jgi:hypothetical protein